jgi:hypothetical protein
MPFQLKVSSVVFGEGALCCESNLQLRCEGYGPYTYIGICLWPLPLALPLACAFDLCSLPSPLDLPFARGFRRCLPWPLPLTSAFALGLLPWVVAFGLCRWPCPWPCLWPWPWPLPLALEPRNQRRLPRTVRPRTQPRLQSCLVSPNQRRASLIVRARAQPLRMPLPPLRPPPPLFPSRLKPVF